MKVGSYYKDGQIQPKHFEKTARLCEFPAHEVIKMVGDMASALPDLAHAVLQEMKQQGVAHPVLDQLTDLLGQRASQISGAFMRQ